MKAENDKTLKDWFNLIHGRTLFLPEFQRRVVWKPVMTMKFMESIARGKPLGMFWVLETGSAKPIFPPKNFHGNQFDTGSCRYLLLDGQQRLTGLWNVLHDKDKERVYYSEFNDAYEFAGVRVISRKSRQYKEVIGLPMEESGQGWFPCRLLNPLADTREVDKWLAEISSEFDRGKLESLIMEKRKVFEGSVIPYFALPAITSGMEALDVYMTINSNSVKLTPHYLAIAEMRKATGKSLYDMEKELEREIPVIKDLETDQLGELILKISCVLQGEKPSGVQYRKLDFPGVIRSRDRIFDGVRWAVKVLGKMKIWDGKQLPTVVPLRVLPGLCEHMPERGQARADANAVIERYLWHAFLTDRYDRQANDRLLKDYQALESVLQSGKGGEKIEVFTESEVPSEKKIREAKWPQGTRLFARGILLVCCRGGANTLASDEALDADEYEKRDRHHIFPRSRFRGKKEISPNLALNCMLVPARDNKEYGKDYPGDYIRKVCEELGMKPDEKIRKRLGTHLISEKLVELLMGVTKESIKGDGLVLENAYKEFIETRARDVKERIDKILEGETE